MINFPPIQLTKCSYKIENIFMNTIPLNFYRLVILALISFSAVLFAAEPVSKSTFGGIAIDGHDTYAYHTEDAATEHKAIEGSKKYTVKHKGAKWRFASQENADAFAADPEKYLPAYNGHCANALSLGEGLIKTDGTHWEIFGDQLYLFYAARGRSRWLNGNFESYKIEADQAWQQIVAD